MPAPSSVMDTLPWIAAHGGLKSQMIYLSGKQLMSMYRPCFLDAHGSALR
jgi:hypothetical protein